MPVVAISERLLTDRLGVDISTEELTDRFHQIGCEVEGVEESNRYRCAVCGNIMETPQGTDAPATCNACGVDFRKNPEALIALSPARVIRLDMLPARPDLFDPGGLARALRAFLGVKTGLREYPVAEPTITVEIDPRLSEEGAYRPHIVCAVVRNVTFDEDSLRSLMRLQETLHWALGRERKRGSIGVYDLKTLEGTGFRYLAEDPDTRTFVPLGGMGGSRDAASMREILAKHPKGTQYAHLLGSFDRFPLLVDGSDRVLSMPPIINSDETRVTLETTDIFVDVTGLVRDSVRSMLHQLVTSVAELNDGAVIEGVRLRHADGAELVTPELTPESRTISAGYVAKRVGVDLSAGEVADRLEKMGYEATVNGSDDIVIRVPAYRYDILHDVDVVEDVAIAHGYDNIARATLPIATVSKELPESPSVDIARGSMLGLGFSEVMTLLLTSPERAFDAMRLDRRDDVVEIESPVSIDQTIVRPSVLPNLMETLAHNRDEAIPQHLFEVGKVSRLDAGEECKSRDRLCVAAALLGAEVGFADIRSTAEALLHEFGFAFEAEAAEHPTFIPGRAARVFAVRDGARTDVGMLGEIHPEVLERLGLVHPVSAFELELEALGGYTPHA
ncbi:MAG: phenylalanine--tRNA ligase subunit beta [Planctomycetota bacterium]